MSKNNKKKEKNRLNLDIKNIMFMITFISIFFLFDIFLKIRLLDFNSFDLVMEFLAFRFDLLFIIIFFIVLNLINQFISKRIAKLYLFVLYFVYFLLFLLDMIILPIKKSPISINMLFFKDEGLAFVNYIIHAFDFLFVFSIVFLIVLIIINFKLFNDYSDSFKLDLKESFLYYGVLIIFCLIIFISTRYDLYASSYDYKIPKKNYYDNYSSEIDSYKILGFYEFLHRDIVLHLSNNNDKESNEDITKFLNGLDRSSEPNNKTGIFKDKNLIMIMMESMDNYVINEKICPNLYNLRKNYWNFNNRYSYLSSSGSTISTEFASIDGLYFNNIIYKNKFPQSIPSVFHNNGYKTISMHQNTGSYYKRNILHKNEYFDESYFLLDMDSNIDINDDLQMADNDEFYNLIVPKDGNKFMTYIITMAAHGPFELDGSNFSEDFPTLAKNTDDFIGRLMERLEEDNLLDDTVILLYTDHQAYTFNYPKSYLKTIKNIDGNYNIKSLPFIIYSSDIKHKDYNMMVNDIDLAPTIFNLFGIEYDPNYYLGSDIFSKDHMNILMFNNSLWYDGKNYGETLNYNYFDYQYNIWRYSLNILENDYYNTNKK